MESLFSINKNKYLLKLPLMDAEAIIDRESI